MIAFPRQKGPDCNVCDSPSTTYTFLWLWTAAVVIFISACCWCIYIFIAKFKGLSTRRAHAWLPATTSCNFGNFALSWHRGYSYSHYTHSLVADGRSRALSLLECIELPFYIKLFLASLFFFTWQNGKVSLFPRLLLTAFSLLTKKWDQSSILAYAYMRDLISILVRIC